MTDYVYKKYDQSQLDAEYNNREKVKNFLAYMAEGAALCATAKYEYPDRANFCFDEISGQHLDIIYPARKPAGALPVQVFFHGGYWKALSKDDFSFVARAFAEYGIATVVVDYQLIPEITMDELVRQCRQSLAFLYQNAADLQLDPSDIHISGHSAGGHLAAMCLATNWDAFDPTLPADLVKSAVGISGLYDLEPISLCFLQQELKLSPEAMVNNSPVRLPHPKHGKMVPVLGGLEGDEYLAQSVALTEAWPGISVQPQVLAPYNHFSIINSLADPTSFLSSHIRQVMKVSNQG